jgi:integral membrane protein (TIGR01906 family)
MKALRLPVRLLFTLCLPVLIFTASIALAFNSPSLYKYGFDKYNISGVTGIEETELEKAARGLIGYWNSVQEPIAITVMKDGQPFSLFNEREIVHLRDVKVLVRLDYTAMGVAGLYCLSYLVFIMRSKRPGSRREAALAGLGGSLVALGLLCLMGIAALTNFSGFWWQFHLLSFANDFWLLDPRTDYLVMMFPEGFWFDSVIAIAGVSTALAVFTGGLSWAVLKRSPMKIP